MIPVSPHIQETAEPRELVGIANEEDVATVNESRQSRALYAPDARLGIWRKSNWITRSKNHKRRSLDNILSRNIELPDCKINNTSINNQSEKLLQTRRLQNTNTLQNTSLLNRTKLHQHVDSRIETSAEVITPKDFAMALAKWVGKLRIESFNSTTKNLTRVPRWESNPSEHVSTKDNFKMEKSNVSQKETPRETREILLDEKLSDDFKELGIDWQSRENVAREMEDVFLRGASQALTQYIEKQLHPAIKETLMLSMGYTISYG